MNEKFSPLINPDEEKGGEVRREQVLIAVPVAYLSEVNSQLDTGI